MCAWHKPLAMCSWRGASRGLEKLCHQCVQFLSIDKVYLTARVSLLRPADHVNEDARALLKKLWRDGCSDNLEVLIPQMVEELNAGYLFTAGVSVSAVC